MNILIIVLVISVCEACRSSIVKPTEDTTAKVNVQVHRTQPLPVPIPKHIIVREGARVTVAWDPINVKKDNPILGIKVFLWEHEKHKVYKDNGTELTFVWEPIQKPINELPSHKPAFEAVLPPDALETTFIVKRGEDYEIRAQSYNEDGDGPLSSATGIMVHEI